MTDMVLHFLFIHQQSFSFSLYNLGKLVTFWLFLLKKLEQMVYHNIIKRNRYAGLNSKTKTKSLIIWIYPLILP